MTIKTRKLDERETAVQLARFRIARAHVLARSAYRRRRAAKMARAILGV